MKEKIFTWAKLIVFMTAISQLALSQIQISVITKVFNPNVGFYLFGFTIFSVLMAFNSSSYEHGKKLPIFIGGLILAVFTGINYINTLLTDIKQANLLTMEDIKTALIISVVAIAIYATGSVVMLATGNYEK